MYFFPFNKYQVQFFFMTLLALGVVPFYKVLGIFGNGWFHYIGYLYLAACILIFALIARYNKWSLKSLGIRKDNLQSSFLPYCTFTIVWISIILLFKFISGRGIDPDWASSIHYMGMFLISAAIQELFLRSFMIRLQKEVFKNEKILILVNALIFSVMHFAFELDTFIIVTASFFLGISFAWIYLKYNNFFFITLSHSVINFLGILVMNGG